MRANRCRLNILLCVLLLAGCVASPPKQALDTDAISAVQAEIKRQVGVYIAAARTSVAITRDGKNVDVTTIPEEFMCGKGKIDFDISEIKAELISTVEQIGDAGGSLKIPWNAITLSPSGDTKRDVTNTETLDYDLWPLPSDQQNPDIFNIDVAKELPNAPIAQVLLGLRRALVLSAMKTDYGVDPPKPRQPQPCFTIFDPSKPAADAGHSFKLGLTFVRDNKGGLEIKVGIVDLTSSLEFKSTSGNTLTVQFVQRGLAEIQYAKDAVDAECKYPNKDSQKCRDATAKLDAIKGGMGGFAVR